MNRAPVCRSDSLRRKFSPYGSISNDMGWRCPPFRGASLLMWSFQEKNRTVGLTTLEPPSHRTETNLCRLLFFGSWRRPEKLSLYRQVGSMPVRIKAFSYTRAPFDNVVLAASINSSCYDFTDASPRTSP